MNSLQIIETSPLLLIKALMNSLQIIEVSCVVAKEKWWLSEYKTGV
jgi:hypothetical protein